MFPFSAKTLALLRQAGWSEAYRYDTAGYERLLETEGYPVHQVAVDFMRRFGGLTITYPHPNPDLKNRTEELAISVSYNRAHIFRLNAESTSAEVGVDLCYIGSYHTRDYQILMDVAGNAYGDGDTLCHSGSSGEEAIENICNGSYGRDLYPDV